MTMSSPAAARNSNGEQFSSEGFDLDALPGSSGGDAKEGEEVIYELGGGTTTIKAPAAPGADATPSAAAESDPDAPPDPLARAESLKSEGNSHFKSGNYLDAYDSYTDAIESCPGHPTGEELLKLKEEFEEKEREMAAERHNREMGRRRRKEMKESEERRRKIEREFEPSAATRDAAAAAAGSDNFNDDEDSEQEDESESEQPPPKFDPPVHPHASILAIYHANRAACNLHLSRPQESIDDCTIALLLNPTYTKAYLRRMAAYESLDQTEEALRDAKAALEIDPRNINARKNVARLQKLEDERLEKLKEETMGKLKDLGNSILGNFGLSLDNFKAVKDESTGSYSISFDQGGGGGGGGSK